MKRLVVMAALAALSGTAQAGDRKDRDDVEVRYQKITEVDFEGLDVKAPITKPTLQYISHTSGLTFKSLIEPRGDFDPEMKHSVDEIK